MSQLRLFLYHIYYKLKDISVLSSLRWVTLWKRQWWECVCSVMAYLLDSLTNKDIFCILQPSFSVWNHEHSIACDMSWERESTSRQRGEESPALLAYIYFRKRSAYVKVTCYNFARASCMWFSSEQVIANFCLLRPILDQASPRFWLSHCKCISFVVSCYL